MATAAFAAAPAITVSEEIAQTGEEVTVEVKLTGNTGFKAYGMILTYNTEELELVSITKGELSTDGNFAKNMTTAKVGYSNSEVVSGDGVLFTATFKVLAGEGEYAVGVNVDAIGLSNDDTMSESVTAGSVTVPHVCDPVAQPGTPTTCVADGVKAHDKCACGKLYIDGVEVSADELVIPATGHDYTAVVTKPTCTEQGYTTYTCRNDSTHVYVDDYVNAAGHNWAWVVDKSATEDETGLKHEECSACGEKRNENTVISALAHDCSDRVKVPEVPATCEKDGVKAHYKCEKYGILYDADGNEVTAEDLVIPAKGHTGKLVGKTDASCEADGYTGDEKCSVCGETLKKGEKIPATGHDYDEDGVCKNCGHVDPETGDASLVFPWVLAMAACIGAAYVTLRRRSNASF